MLCLVTLIDNAKIVEIYLTAKKTVKKAVMIILL